MPQINNIFTELTVRENLEMGAFLLEGNIQKKINEMYQLFPMIKEKKDQFAGELSGGQRQSCSYSQSITYTAKSINA